MQQVEQYFDRTRLKKSLLRWRVFGVLALLAGLIWAFASPSDPKVNTDHIARLTIEGVITGDSDTLALVREIAASDHAKAVIVRINSPGGTTVGSEALYEELRKLGKDKPIVAVMDSIAASGGYITALATDHIVARGNTLTGSIGVIFTFPDLSKLLDTIGVKMEEIKSGDMKAEPNGFRPVSEKTRAVSQAMVQDSFDWFLGLVAERRKMPDAKTRTLADGRAFTGRQALKEGLIDELGGEDRALLWLQKEKSLDTKLEVMNWRVKSAFDPSLFGFSSKGWIARGLGLETAIENVAIKAEAIGYDGLLVLWSPAP
jgi:protease IV